MASPLTKGLFVSAIGESGGALTTIAAFGPKPLQIGEQDGIKFIEAMGLNSIAELRAKSAQEILEAAIKSPITYAFGVVDGYVVPEHPAASAELNKSWRRARELGLNFETTTFERCNTLGMPALLKM
jgi:carboxylesterase type B